MKNKSIILILMSVVLFGLNSCSDDAPTTFKQMKQCETVLMVGNPIQDVKLLNTQPLDDPYYYENAVIRDADVSIITEGDTFNLVFDETTLTYKYPDESVTVQPKQWYHLVARFSDGDVMTGKTYTPATFSWDQKPHDVAQFPIDTTNIEPADSLAISWTKSPGTVMYLINIKCLDTLDYGIYLDPPQPENKNRRTYSFFNDTDPFYFETTFYAFIGNQRTDFIWLSFKWFGKHEVNVYAPDYNFMRWAMAAMRFTGSNEYDPNLSSVEGGLGVFGSAAYVSHETFILKNQP